MQQQLLYINELAKEVQALLPMKEEYQRNLDKKIRLEFNYNSNHIEGNTLTYGETELLLIFGKTNGNHELREYEEVQSHDVAFRRIQEWAAEKERPLTEMAIKNLNEIILVKPYWKDAETPDGQFTKRQIKIGDYKEFSNHVRLQNGEMFYYASPAETPIQMGELMEWFREEKDGAELHPVALAALLHYKFVRIHPFDDGNGRISRLLMNYVLLQNNLPPVIIKSADKKNYLFALNQADAGDIESFITYIAEQLIYSLELYLTAAKGKSLDEPGDLDKKLFLLKKKLGEDVNAKVELKYGEEAINNVLQNALLPLAKSWEEQLQKFDSFFYSRTAFFSFGSIEAKSNSVEKVTIIGKSELLKNYSGKFDSDIIKSGINKIFLGVNYVGLRNRDDISGMSAGDISFLFYQDMYEITYNYFYTYNINKKINKLYNQPLTEEEIITITESLGNWFYTQLEEIINNT